MGDDRAAGARGPWVGLLAILTGTLIGTYNNAAANVALPDVLADLDIPVGVGAWFVAAYVLALAVSLPVAGRLADSLGTRRVFVGGLLAFVAASVLVAAGGSYGLVLLGRVGQGVFNAPVLPTIMITVVALFPGDQRGKAMGTWVAVNGAAFALSPLLAGWLTDAASWRAVFWVNVALTLASIPVVLRHVPDVPATHRAGRFPVTDAGLLVGGLVALMVALLRAPAWGWTAPLTLSLAGGGVLLMLWFGRRSLRTDEPFLDLGILARPGYAVPATVAGLQTLVLFGVMLVTPLMLVHLFGTSFGAAGALVFLLPASWTLASPLVGHLADRAGVSLVMLAGTLLLAVGSGALVLGVTTRALATVVTGMLCVGLGVAAVQSTAAVAVSSAVRTVSRGASLGTFHTVRFLAGVVGAALYAIVLEVTVGTGRLESAPPGALQDGFTVVLALGTVLSLAATAVWVGGRRTAALLTAPVRAGDERSATP